MPCSVEERADGVDVYLCVACDGLSLGVSQRGGRGVRSTDATLRPRSKLSSDPRDMMPCMA